MRSWASWSSALGPTGLTLAAQLDALGATVRVVDRQLDRVHESRALAVLPRTLEVLRGLGISRRLVERGNDAVQLQLHFGERVVRTRLFDIGLEDTAYPFLLFVSQAETEAVLSEHLAARGVRVERGVELVAFAADEQQVDLHAPSSGRERASSSRARYLAGCDGARSSVRRLAGIPFEGGSYPQTFALGDLEVERRPRPRCRACLHRRAGDAVLLPARPAGELAHARHAADRARREPSTASCPSPRWPTCRRSPMCSPAARSACATRSLQTYFCLHHLVGRPLPALAGSFSQAAAAHVHSPAGAQGMNTGIQDACNLGWKLALVSRGLADVVLLDAMKLSVGRLLVRAFASPTSHRDRDLRQPAGASDAGRQVAPRPAPLAFRLPPRPHRYWTLAGTR